MPTETAQVDMTEDTNQEQASSESAPAESQEQGTIVDRDDLDLGYQVSLDAFSGPMDLLLYLVRRSEVDIADVPIAEIADQFLATLQVWDEMDLDVAGDFILMAASLLELKARMVVPPDEDAADEEEDFIDPREELIHQLLQFRKFKEATQLLQRLEDNNLLVHHRKQAEQIPEAEDQAEYNLENADPYQLFVLWDQTLVSIAGKRPRTVVYDDIPIEQRVRQVLSTMEKTLEGQLNWLFGTVETRIQRIGVFVAVLECVRKSYLEAVQHEQYGSVYLRYREEEERAKKAEVPPLVEIDEEPRKRRRKRRQLVTYQAPEGLEQDEPEQEVLDLEEEEVSVETDEQRFLRELNEETAVDNLLSIGKDLDAAMQAHLYDQGVLEDVVEEANDEFDDEEDEDDSDDDDEFENSGSMLDAIEDEEHEDEDGDEVVDEYEEDDSEDEEDYEEDDSEDEEDYEEDDIEDEEDYEEDDIEDEEDTESEDGFSEEDDEDDDFEDDDDEFDDDEDFDDDFDDDDDEDDED